MLLLLAIIKASSVQLLVAEVDTSYCNFNGTYTIKDGIRDFEFHLSPWEAEKSICTG
jgi:hypothetical protein